jgi:uncharacterized protein (DUF488 family)
MRIFTIGFTQKSAESFFSLVRESGAERLVDVRLNNVSQLAGFAKRDDLRYFLRELTGVEYFHELSLAPTQQLLDGYRKRGTPWVEYASGYLELLRERQVEETIPYELLNNSVLLCSEHAPQYCHRRLLAEYLAERWDDVTVTHL